MITPKFLILVICLLQAQRAFAFNYTFTLWRCLGENPDTACFVRESCLTEEGKADVLVPFTSKSFVQQDITKCDAIVQIKPFTAKKWHVIMKVMGADLDITKGIRFTQGQIQFSCKSEMTTLEGELNPKEFGGGHTFSSNLMSCSILIESRHDTIVEQFSSNSNKPILSYHANGQEKKVEFSSTGDKFWTIHKDLSAHCNPEKIHSKDGVHGNFVLLEVDVTRNTFDFMSCHEFHVTGSSSKLVLRLNGTYIDIDGLRCDTDKINGSYIYFKANTSDIERIGPETPSFGLFCPVEACSQCKPFVFNNSCENCHGGVESTEGKCKIATCPSDKWRQSDGSVIESTVKCRHINGLNVGWFMAGSDEEITKGSCLENLDCHLYSKFNFSCPIKDCTQAVLSEDKMRISCPAEFRLKIESEDLTGTDDSLTCRPSNGRYYTKDTSSPSRGANVYCQRDCFYLSKPDFSCTTEGCSKPSVSFPDRSLSCPEGFDLKFGLETLTCDFATGFFTGKVKERENIYCEKRSTAAAPAAPAAPDEAAAPAAPAAAAVTADDIDAGTKYGIIGFIIGFFVALALSIVVGFIVMNMQKREPNTQSESRARPSKKDEESEDM